uniref:Uncharacterized protein n=1 Tax=viral metagenome TaxID=1070528 RepID=A0A6C0BRA3_9ZZZZ
MSSNRRLICHNEDNKCTDHDRCVRAQDRLEEEAILVRGFCKFTKSSLERLSLIHDPHMRSLMLVDRILFQTDVFVALLSTRGDRYSEDLQKQIAEALDLWKIHFTELMHVLQAPTLAPDTPMGYQIMKEAEKSFNEKASSGSF